ncbi:MAG: glycosyltransferase family 1 protein [Ktedonobacteraceae bacterium]|nr:glycosyltransferase family 1 protein [Ktedonobacteraceae bacterium]
MRIAFFTETFLPQTNGIVTRLCHTLAGLQKRHGDRVLVIAPDMPGLPARYEGATVLGVPSVSLPFYTGFRLGLPLMSAQTRAALTAFSADLVHAVNPVGGIGLLALHYAAQHHLPLVASFNTNLPDYARYYGFDALEQPLWHYLRWIHNQAHLNLCPSSPVQARLQEQGIRNTALWRSGVDTELFHPQRRSHLWRERLTNGHADDLIILSVGRLAAEKGLDRLIAILPQLPGCHLALVGDGPAAAHLRQIASGLPVTFAGTLTGADLAAAYASADLFALPSSTETFGFVTLEAQAAGLPVVAARRGGTLSLVLEGQSGLLFEPDSQEEMLCALRTLIEQPEERVRMGLAARRHIETAGWSWEAAISDLRLHYEQVITAASNARTSKARQAPVEAA